MTVLAAWGIIPPLVHLFKRLSGVQINDRNALYEAVPKSANGNCSLFDVVVERLDSTTAFKGIHPQCQQEINNAFHNPEPVIGVVYIFLCAPIIVLGDLVAQLLMLQRESGKARPPEDRETRAPGIQLLFR